MAPPYLRDIPFNVDTLKRLFHYDPETGLFRRLCQVSNAHQGRVSTTPDSVGYISICINYKKYRAHRLAWLYMTGEWPEFEIDHIDRNRTNNAFLNLRAVTRLENSWNTGTPITNKSGKKGVHWNSRRSKWVAQIVRNGRYRNIGSFTTLEEAALAYDRAAS